MTFLLHFYDAYFIMYLFITNERLLIMKHIFKHALCTALVLSATSALAGGYQLNDYSVTGLGRSYAGQGIMGDDYSAIAFNPAGMRLMNVAPV